MADIRLSRTEDREAILQFLSEQWGVNHILVRQPELLDWQFGSNLLPNLGQGAITALTAWENGRLVGFQGLMGQHFRIGGESVSGAYLAMLTVAPDARGRGVGLRLMKAVHDLPLDIVAVNGIGKDALRLYKRFGYHINERSNRYVCVINAARVSALTGAQVQATCVVNNVKQGECQVKAASFGDDWDRFWSEIAGQDYCGTERNGAYMQWRYQNHPIFTYKVIACGEGSDLRAAAVVRLEKVRDQPDIVLRVLEFGGHSADDRLALAHDVIRHAHQVDASLLDYYQTGGAMPEELQATGFIEEGAVQAVVPARFNPLDNRLYDVPSAMRARRSHLKEGLESLMVLKSDGDQDRPN